MNKKCVLEILTVFLATSLRTRQSNLPGPNALQILAGLIALLSFPA